MPKRAGLFFALYLVLCMTVACTAGCGVQVHPKGQVITGIQVGKG